MSPKPFLIYALLCLSACATPHQMSSSQNAPLKKTSLQASATPVKPKYGPEIILLSQSHEYIQHHIAPDYWAISPYYLPQQDDRSCSLASVTMIINAARMNQKFTADDELATQKSLLKKVNDVAWTKALGEGGHGVSLDQLKQFVEESAKAYQIENLSVRVVHTEDGSAKTKKQLHQDLLENERSANNFIIANFLQGVYTGDAMEGHLAPVGAYDRHRKQVLIMDPDRQWYEPYWVSEETFLKGMTTTDTGAGQSRGYLFISIERTPKG